MMQKQRQFPQVKKTRTKGLCAEKLEFFGLLPFKVRTSNDSTTHGQKKRKCTDTHFELRTVGWGRSALANMDTVRKNKLQGAPWLNEQHTPNHQIKQLSNMKVVGDGWW